MAPPVFVAPVDDEELIALSPILFWSQDVGADTYEVQVAEDAGFSTLVVNETGLPVAGLTSRRLRVRDLDRETEYFARVRSVTGGTPSAWDTISFTTGEAAAVRYAVRVLMGEDLTNLGIGLVNGSFCWVSGSNKGPSLREFDLGPEFTQVKMLDDVPVNPFTEVAEEDWWLAFLLRGKIGSPSYNLDTKDGGTYGTQSNLTFSVRNTTSSEGAYPRISVYLAENEKYLHKKIVEFYVISDGIFKLWWTGEVESFSFDELDLSIQAIDRFKSLHKEFPPEKVTRELYPSARDEVIGSPVPVSIGHATYSPLVPISSDGVKKDVFENEGGTRFKITAIGTVTGASLLKIPSGTGYFEVKLFTIQLKTGALVVVENQWKGLFVNLVSGAEAAAEVYENEDSSTITGLTTVRLLVGFTRDGDTEPIPAAEIPEYFADGNTQAWWVELVEHLDQRLVSHYPISGFEILGHGTDAKLTSWDNELKKNRDVSWLARKAFPLGLPGNGLHAGVELRTASNLDLKLKTVKYHIKPESVTMVASGATNGNGITTGITVDENTFPADAANAPNLYDRDIATLYRVEATTNSASGDRRLRLFAHVDIELPTQALASSEDTATNKNGLCLVFLARYGVSGVASRSLKIYTKIYAVDILGGTSGNIIGVVPLDPGLHPPARVVDDGEYLELNYIDAAYFGLDYKIDTVWSTYSQMNGVLTRSKDFFPIPTVRVFFEVVSEQDAETDFSMSMEIAEVTLLRLIPMEEAPEKIDCKVIGESFGGATGPVGGPAWDGRRNAADPVLHVVDAIEYILREYDGIGSLVHTASFDATKTLVDTLAESSDKVTVGRGVIESKNSAEMLRELCRHGNVCLVPRPDGKRGMCWAPTTITGLKILGPGDYLGDSLSSISMIPLQNYYNEFEVKYDYNPNRGAFMREMFVRHIDQAAFPGENELVETAGDDSTQAVTNVTNQGFGYIYVSVTDPGRFRRGVRATLVDGPSGFEFEDEIVLNVIWIESLNTWFLLFLNPGNHEVLPAGPSVATALVSVKQSRTLKWKTFVGGVIGYAHAAVLWEAARSNYEKTGTINKMNLELPWFSSKQDWGLSPEDAPYYLLISLVYMFQQTRASRRLRLPLTPEFLDLVIGEDVQLDDPQLIRFGGQPSTMSGKVVDLRLDTTRNEIEAELLLNEVNQPI